MTPSGSLRWAASWAVLALLLLGPARGHFAGSMGYATVSLYGGTVRYSLTLGPDALAVAGGAAALLVQPPPRGGYDTLADLVARKVTISADGVRCEPVPGTVTPPSPDRANAVVIVDYACPGTPRELVLRDDLFDALGRDYHTLVRVEAMGSVQQYTLEPEQREARVAVAAPTGSGTPEVSAGSGIFAFFRLGVEHILTGVDHLLFVLALVLRGGGIGTLFAVVTAFTAMLQPEFLLHGATASTGGCAVFVVLNGPMRRELGAAGSFNALGNSDRATAVIGRAIRLALINILEVRITNFYSGKGVRT